MGVGAGDDDLAGLQRLAQGIERLRGVLGQFVEEEHAVVGQRSFARLGAKPAAGQGGHGGGVMWGAEGPVAGQSAALDQPGHRPDHGGLQQLLGRQRRQQAGQPRGHHRLARSRRADEEQVVAAGGGDLQRPLGAFLSLDLAQVGDAVAATHGPRLGPSQHLRALEVVDQGDQRARRQHGHVAGPGGFGPVRLGTDEAQSHGVGGDRGGQGPAHRRDPPIQPQFAHRRPTRQGVRRDHAHRGQQGQGDGQVEMVALLAQVRRREVGDDAHRRQGQAYAREGSTHPLAALGHRLVGEPHEGEAAFVAGMQLRHLHINAPGVDAFERNRDDVGVHRALPLSEKERNTNSQLLQERRYAARFFSMASHIRAAALTPVKRSNC